jgi:zinc/manganese transport system substrate-binding protein
VLDVFQLPFTQRAVCVLLLLAVAGGLLGTWIVLRGLAFYSHAVGTAAFPGLVLADGLGFAAPLGAAGAALVLAAGVWLVTRSERSSTDSATAIVLVGCLAVGVVLASDVFESGSNIETLLFGSLLVIGGGDIALAAAAAVVAVVLTLVLGPRWLARGFDPDLPGGGRVADAALLAAVAFAAIAALTLVGALLATALLVVPAATTRLWFDRLLPWQLATVALTAVEGVIGIWLAVQTNAPPGATIAVLAGAVFLVSVLARVARTRAVLPAGAAALALLVAGCGSGAGANSGALPVVATTTQVADLTRAVGGDRTRVTQLLQPNSDPHSYEPRPRDVRDVAAARVVLVNGLGLDDWAGDVVERSGGDPEVVDLGASVPVKRPGDGHDRANDPHWFHDPRNARVAVDRIRGALAAADPGGADAYRANADAYLAKLAALDRGIERCFDPVPPARRKLVTDHDAFGYFTDRYGIQVVGAVIPSQTTQAQPSARDTADLARLIERERVQAIFPEESLNPRVAQALADQTGATAEYHLYGDTLGPKGTPGGTYLGMERANADAMVRGFTGGEHGCAIEGVG